MIRSVVYTELGEGSVVNASHASEYFYCDSIFISLGETLFPKSV